MCGHGLWQGQRVILPCGGRHRHRLYPPLRSCCGGLGRLCLHPSTEQVWAVAHWGKSRSYTRRLWWHLGVHWSGFFCFFARTGRPIYEAAWARCGSGSRETAGRSTRFPCSQMAMKAWHNPFGPVPRHCRTSMPQTLVMDFFLKKKDIFIRILWYIFLTPSESNNRHTSSQSESNSLLYTCLLPPSHYKPLTTRNRHSTDTFQMPSKPVLTKHSFLLNLDGYSRRPKLEESILASSSPVLSGYFLMYLPNA